MKQLLRLSICLLVAIVLVLNSIAAQAEDKPETITNDYTFETYWGGFKVGEMHIIENASDENFSIIATIGSRGIAKIVSNYSSINVVSGSKVNGKYVPKLYHSKWWRKKEAQDIELQFSSAGEVIKETLTPPERVGKRPIVEQKYKKNVVDPVTAAFVSRETIRSEIKKNPNSTTTFSVPTVDGKRRFNVLCEIKGYKKIDIGGKMQNLLHVAIRREPIAGFRDRDLKEMREQQELINFYLDEDFVPVWGSAKAQMGSATIKLVSKK